MPFLFFYKNAKQPEKVSQMNQKPLIECGFRRVVLFNQISVLITQTREERAHYTSRPTGLK